MTPRQPILWVFVLCLSVTACSGDLLGSSATPTPRRLDLRDAVHITETNGNLLQVSLETLTLAEDNADPLDTQVIAVLSDERGSPAYLVYPSNQPGVADQSLDLSDYPLQIDAETAVLWVLAVRYDAYRVAQDVGLVALGAQLAQNFQSIAMGEPPTVLASVVAQSSSSLLGWLGAIEVLGEIIVPIDGETLEEATVETDGFSLTYSVSSESIALIAPPNTTPSPVPSSEIAEATDFSEAGYRLVVDETFDNDDSQFEWWIGQDANYRSWLVDGAYQIDLTDIEERRREGGLFPVIWGSLQNYYFQDYIVRARVSTDSADYDFQTGLWLHYLDEFNFIYFGIDTSGQYRIARFRSGYRELTDEWVADPVVNTDGEDNWLTIQMQDETYTLFINGEQVAEVTDDAFDIGRIAFFCAANTDPVDTGTASCRLEDLQVWIPEESPFPVPTPGTE